MPIQALTLHRAVVSILLAMLAISTFPSNVQAKAAADILNITPSAIGGSNTCRVESCAQCGQTCTGGYDKNGGCNAWTCKTCTITSASLCPATCTVTSCGRCGQTCTGGYDKNSACMGWSCNRCQITDAAACGRGCPTTIPAVVDAFDARCFATAANSRCASEISQAACTALIANASRVGLVTADGASWLSTNGYCPILRPDGTGLFGFCPMGCFAADTQILTELADNGSTSYTPIKQLAADSSVLGVSDDAGMDDVDLVSRLVGRVVQGPETPPLVVLALSNGHTLRVTMRHPMVLATGVIVEASAVEQGATMTGVDGQPVTVTAIKHEPAADDVFNLETNGTTQLSHVIVAEGVLIGDLKLQNELASEQRLIALRR